MQLFVFTMKFYHQISRLLKTLQTGQSFGEMRYKILHNLHCIPFPLFAKPSSPVEVVAHNTQHICHTINIPASREYEHTSLINNNKAFKNFVHTRLTCTSEAGFSVKLVCGEWDDLIFWDSLTDFHR